MPHSLNSLHQANQLRLLVDSTPGNLVSSSPSSSSVCSPLYAPSCPLCRNERKLNSQSQTSSSISSSPGLPSSPGHSWSSTLASLACFPSTPTKMVCPSSPLPSPTPTSQQDLFHPSSQIKTSRSTNTISSKKNSRYARPIRNAILRRLSQFLCRCRII